MSAFESLRQFGWQRMLAGELFVTRSLFFEVCLNFVRVRLNERDSPANPGKRSDQRECFEGRFSRPASLERVVHHIQPNAGPDYTVSAVANFHIFVGRHDFHREHPVDSLLRQRWRLRGDAAVK